MGTKTAPAIGSRVQGMHCMGHGGGTVLDNRGEVTAHTRDDDGKVRGIAVRYPDGETTYSLATRGEFWRHLPAEGEPEAWR